MKLQDPSPDVLVVGGGLAGAKAAMGAAEKGARVIVAHKGKIERSGSGPVYIDCRHLTDNALAHLMGSLG